MPTNEREWLKIAKDFNDKWNFPHCLGAIDGKHVVMKCPANTGSQFYNYKGTFSIVLLAIVDASYNFQYVHVGCQGRISDGGVFHNTDVYKKIENKTLGLPEHSTLPSGNVPVPYLFVVDDAFALTRNMMKPFPFDLSQGNPKRIFNGRLSRARRIVENAFGILSAVFRVLRKPFETNPEIVEIVTLACVYLHNFLRAKSSRELYTPSKTFDLEDTDSGIIIPGSWRQEIETGGLIALQRKPRKSSHDAENIRNELLRYFLNEGSVSWQNKYL